VIDMRAEQHGGEELQEAPEHAAVTRARSLLAKASLALVQFSLEVMEA
jgi:hypothetical protein